MSEQKVDEAFRAWIISRKDDHNLSYNEAFAAGRAAQKRESQPTLQTIYRIVHGWSMDQTVREVELIQIRQAINELDPFDEARRIEQGGKGES